MNNECHFFIEINAPSGLFEIEQYLHKCKLPLETWITGFNGDTILRPKRGGDEELEWEMDPSTSDIMVASGFIFKPLNTAWSDLLSLSEVLKDAGFPHYISIDDEDGNLGYSTKYLWKT